MKEVWKEWQPLHTEITRETARVEVSGRAYELRESAFPSAVSIGGAEFLARPVELVGVFAGREERKLTECVYHALSQSDERAVFQLSSRMGNAVIDGRITCDFDGFLEICLSVIPFWSFAKDGLNAPQLEKLFIDIPVKREFAPLYHYWPNDRTSIIPNANIVNADALPEGGVKLPFKPYVWLGDEFRGLGVSMETDENIEVYGPQAEYIVREGEVILRLRLLDHMPAAWQGQVDEWTRALSPMDYRVGLMATPVKPVSPEHRRDWRSFHVFSGMFLNEQAGALEYLAASGVKWVIFHEGISRVQNYGMPEDEARFRALISACHAHGMKTMVYFGYEYSTLAPDWFEKAKDYLINTPEGGYTGGWQRKPWQRDFMVCYRGGYSQAMIERVKFVMDEYGVDGIYTDGTYVPWECANPRHGCGYMGRDGKRHATFPIFAVRDHVKRLYEAVHQRGGLIDTHQSSCCLAPTLSFCDSYYDGENIQGALIRCVTEGRSLTSFLNLPAFRAEYMGKNLGLIDQFIAYTNPSIGWTIEKLASLTLIHDVIPRPRKTGEAMTRESLETDLRFISRVWRAFDEYGATAAAWLPYWQNGLCETEGAYLSVYQGEKPLGVLSNLTQESMTVTVKTDKPRVLSVLTGETFEAKDGKVSFTAESCYPYLLAL